MGEDKRHINIVLIGHVLDTTGHLMDKLGVANGKFETSKYYCTVIDAHEQADCALLIIGSTTSVSILCNDGLIEHTLRAFALGWQQLICCCCSNEMQAAFSKDHYDGIVREASSYLKDLGYNHNKITFVPVAGSKDNNMIEISTNLEWYNGPTLHEAIDQVNRAKRPVREESCHKNQLQGFTLKKYQKYPVYTTRYEGEPHDCKFWSTIEVDGQHFKSVHLHVHKKEAEQDVAKVAYEFLIARDGDNFADVLALIDKTVSVAGKEYIGEIGKSKSDAAEKAARVAVKSMLDTNDECMLKVFRAKRRLTTRTPYSLYNKEGITSFPCVSWVPSNQPSEKHTIKTSAPDREAPGLVASAELPVSETD